MKGETQAVQEGLISHRVFQYGLIVSLLLIFTSLMQNCGSISRSSKSAVSSVQKPSIVKPKIPNFPINFCKDAQAIQLNALGDRAVIESFGNCGSKVVFVPFGRKFMIKANDPGITKICFWLNGRCARIKAIRNSDNLELGANVPARSALRFSSNPAGKITVQLVNY